MKKIINIYDQLHWDEANGYPKGTRIKVLRDENGAKTILLKLPEGFYMAPHSHITVEQHFVLEGEYQSGGFGDPSKHPNIWAVAIMTDGQWARVHNARGQGREWSNLDRLEKWLREQGINQWQLLNNLEK